MSLHPSVPRTIKLGGDIFVVKEAPNLRGIEDARARLHVVEQYIEIDPSGTPASQWRSLLHEVLEVANYDFQLNLPHAAIMTLDHFLYQVLVDNDLPLREADKGAGDEGSA